MREYVAQLRGDEKTLVAELEIQGAPWRRRPLSLKRFKARQAQAAYARGNPPRR